MREKGGGILSMPIISPAYPISAANAPLVLATPSGQSSD